MTISWSGGGEPGDWGAGRGDGLRDFVVARGREEKTGQCPVSSTGWEDNWASYISDCSRNSKLLTFVTTLK